MTSSLTVLRGSQAAIVGHLCALAAGGGRVDGGGVCLAITDVRARRLL